MSRQQLSSYLPSLGSLGIALLSGLVLFSNSVMDNLTSFIINTGLDLLRAQLIAALIMTAGAALFGAIIGRRKAWAMLGAGSIFCFSYLFPFIQLELQPFYDPGGIAEPVNSGALLYTSSMMLALALLAAFIGAAVGKAVAEVLLDPPYQMVRLLWQRHTPVDARKTMIVAKQEVSHLSAIGVQTRWQRARSWLASFMLLSLLLLASGSGDLFIFSPDIGLHSSPLLHNGRGMAIGYGTTVQDELVSAALNGQRRPFLVYLPPSYNNPQGRTKRYPVLYLLHGSPGGEHDWFMAGKANQSTDTLIALGRIPELILVAPDGNGRAGATSEWGNSFDRRQNIETYIATDLVRYVDQKYRTIADAAHRGIGGLSMGGFGAMNIAVHHPDIFGTVISLGGYYRAEGSIWGGNTAYLRENSPLDILPSTKQAWHLHIYIGAATKDQPYYTDSMQFVQELTRLHIPYRLDIQNGFHSWRVWQVQLYNALLWLHWG